MQATRDFLRKLPADLVVKVSVQMGAANPISVRWMEQPGAGTYNVPTDLSLPQLAATRQAISMPLDVYVEVPAVSLLRERVRGGPGDSGVIFNSLPL